MEFMEANKMNTLEEISSRINAAVDHQITKPAGYYRVYDRYFQGMSHLELRILEIGVYTGESLKALATFFSRSTVVGLDIDIKPIDFSGFSNVHYLQADQTDAARLREIVVEYAPGGFDIIIDDASHIGYYSLQTYNALFQFLKPGGFYVIEDWGTGYWDDWPDGGRMQVQRVEEFDGLIPKRIPSHDFGMVGFVKHLVDEVNAADVKPSFSSPQTRPHPYEYMHLYPGIAIIKKVGG